MASEVVPELAHRAHEKSFFLARSLGFDALEAGYS
jgi:hypothetical protein